jgi:hypothetical protein
MERRGRETNTLDSSFVCEKLCMLFGTGSSCLRLVLDGDGEMWSCIVFKSCIECCGGNSDSYKEAMTSNSMYN